MEDLCRDVRVAMNQVAIGFYDDQFKKLFPNRDPSSILTPSELQRILASADMSGATWMGRFNGYMNALNQLREDERNAALIKHLSAPCTSCTAPACSKAKAASEHAIQFGASLPINLCLSANVISNNAFKSLPIAKIKQKPPISDVNKQILDSWITANAAAIFDWADPKNREFIDIQNYVRGEVTVAYLLAHNKMDLFETAKCVFTYGEWTWTKLMRDGDVITLDWLIKDGCRLPPSCLFRIAATNNHVNVLQYLADKYGIDEAAEVLYYGAAEGHVDVIKWAFSNRLTSDRVIATASSAGHLHIITWMKSVGLA